MLLSAGAHPEELAVTDQDLYTYSNILSDGESVKEIKQEAEFSMKPKGMDEDTAMNLYLADISQANADLGQDFSKPKPKVPAKALNQVKEDVKVDDSESKKQESENTEKWAHAKLDEEPQSANKTSNEKAISREEYNQMFHLAVTAANSDLGKSFEQLQREDLERKIQEEQDQLAEERDKVGHNSENPLQKDLAVIEGDKVVDKGQPGADTTSFAEIDPKIAMQYAEEQAQKVQDHYP